MAHEEFRAQTHAENRRYPRLNFKLWVHFRCLSKGEVSEPLESLAEDLGTQGMAMRSDHPLRVGQLLRTTLYVPPESRRKSAEETPIYEETDCLPVEILARVVWCNPLESGEYMLGIQFLDPNPAHRNRLKSFLVDYELDDPNSALYT
jgi:c-di-GMP-binding flagellar brake protein YcgR